MCRLRLKMFYGFVFFLFFLFFQFNNIALSQHLLNEINFTTYYVVLSNKLSISNDIVRKPFECHYPVPAPESRVVNALNNLSKDVNALNALSKDEIIDLFEKLSCTRNPRFFFYALSSLSPNNFNLVFHSLSSYTIGCQLERLLEGGAKISSLLVNFSVVQQGYLLSSANSTEMKVESCYIEQFLKAPDYGLPTLDFAILLQSLLLNATMDQIKEIPLTEYSSDDLAKALQGLPQEKRNAVLNALPPDRRSVVESVPQ